MEIYCCDGDDKWCGAQIFIKQDIMEAKDGWIYIRLRECKETRIADVEKNMPNVHCDQCNKLIGFLGKYGPLPIVKFWENSLVQCVESTVDQSN